MYFPEESDESIASMVERLLESKTTQIYRPGILAEVINHLNTAPDAQRFPDLSEKVKAAEIQEFVQKRFGASREKASSWTPQCIKDLRPDGPGIYLVWQISASAFEAYYPKALFPTKTPEGEEEGPKIRKRAKTPSNIKKHVTCSRQYGAIRTQISALTQCVNFLWKMHSKAGQVSWLDLFGKHASQYRTLIPNSPRCLSARLSVVLLLS